MPCIKIDKSHIVRQNKIIASDMCLIIIFLLIWKGNNAMY